MSQICEKKTDLGRNSHESEFAWQRTAHRGRIEKKWAEMKSASVRIISARRYPKTGGGKKDKEPWYVSLVLDILGVDTTLVDGIVGK